MPQELATDPLVHLRHWLLPIPYSAVTVHQHVMEAYVQAVRVYLTHGIAAQILPMNWDTMPSVV